MKKNATGERIEMLRRIAALETENQDLQLKAAEHAVQVATLERQIANLKRDRDAQEERLGWVRSLVSGAQLRPRDLADSRPK